MIRVKFNELKIYEILYIAKCFKANKCIVLDRHWKWNGQNKG